MVLVRTAALSAVVLAAACSSSGGSGGSGGERRSAQASATTVPAATTSVPADPATAGTRVRITFGSEVVEGTVRDSAAGRDLVAQLPLEVEMTDHGGVEKTGRLPRALSTRDEPDGADPDVGAIGYYAPGSDLVLYYGDQSYFDGIVVVGEMDDGFEALGRVNGGVTVRVEAVGPS
jgi:hypothetical protein